MILNKQQKNQEQRLRYALNKKGYLLRKSRHRLSMNNCGDYMIVDKECNCVIAGSLFNYTLEDVEAWLNED